MTQLLVPGGIITGTVQDCAENPLSDVVIRIFRGETVEVTPSPTPTQIVVLGATEREVVSNELGEYSVLGLPDGQYYVFAEGKRLGYENKYYPDADFADEAVTVVIMNHSHQNDKNLQLCTTARISGVITNDSGTPIPKIPVIASLDTESSSESSWTDDSGVYTIWGLLTGQYTLSVIGGDTGFEDKVYPTPILISEPTEYPGKNFTLEQSGGITGNLDYFDARPVAVIIGCYADSSFSSLIKKQGIYGQETYTFEGLHSGYHYIRAYLDSNGFDETGDGGPDPSEPVGVYGGLENPQPVTVVAGEVTGNIDITILEPTPSGTPSPSPTPDNIPPAAPTVDPLPAVVSQEEIIISGHAETGVKVRIDGGKETRWSFALADMLGAFHVSVPLIKDQTNYFSVVAIDGSGNSSDSIPLSIRHNGNLPEPPNSFTIGEPDVNGDLIIYGEEGSVEPNHTIEIKNLRTDVSETISSGEDGEFCFESLSHEFSAEINDPIQITVINQAGTRSASFTGVTGTEYNEDRQPQYYSGRGIGTSIIKELIPAFCNNSELDVLAVGLTEYQYLVYPNGTIQGSYAQKINVVKNNPCDGLIEQMHTFMGFLPTNHRYTAPIQPRLLNQFNFFSNVSSDITCYVMNDFYYLVFGASHVLSNVEYAPENVPASIQCHESSYRIHVSMGEFEYLQQYNTHLNINESKLWCKLENAVVAPGNSVKVGLLIVNNHNVQKDVTWEVSQLTGSPNVVPSPNSGSTTLGPYGALYSTITMSASASTLAQNEATMLLEIGGDVEAIDHSYVCIIPTGETSMSVGWYQGGIHKWQQSLTPITSDAFFDRQVTEVDPGEGGEDTCWYEGLPRAWRTIKVTGGSWNVFFNNVWGYDYVGFSEFLVLKYRLLGVTACGLTVPQRMVIDCPSCGEQPYQDNILEARINNITVSSTRDGQTVTRVWPEE